MRINNKTFVPDLASDSVQGTPGKGKVRLTKFESVRNTNDMVSVSSPKLVSNVRFNQFGKAPGNSQLIDRADSSNLWNFRRGIENDAGNSAIESGVLVGMNNRQKIYKSPAITQINFEGSDAKMHAEYVQQALSLGRVKLPQRCFVQLDDASSMSPSNLGPNSSGGAGAVYGNYDGQTYMFRVMVDSGRQTASHRRDKCAFAIAGAAGHNIYASQTAMQMNIVGAPSAAAPYDSASSTVAVEFMLLDANGTAYTLSTAAGSYGLVEDEWYTVFLRFALPFDNTTNNNVLRQEIQIFSMKTGAQVATATNDTTAFIGFRTLTGTPRAIIGYGEDGGGVNTDYTLNDFIEGVNLAEFACWAGALNDDTIKSIAKAHLLENPYKSGLDNRPVKRVQQIFDSMDAFPAQTKTTGKRLDRSQDPYNSMIEKNFGLIEPMVYPEMIPARLYSGSGGYFGGKRLQTDANPNKALGYGSSYFPYLFGSGTQEGFFPSTKYMRGTLHEVPLKDGQFKDIMSTPFEWRLVTTGAQYPGVAHRETEILNKISVKGYGTGIGQSLSGALDAALGGHISPFDDNAAPPNAEAINEIATPESVIEGLNQRLGDIVRIEIPIPTIEDAVMGVDAAQGRIASMAYYNFETQKWDRKFMPGISGSNVRSVNTLNGTGGPSEVSNNFWNDARDFLLHSCSIGFGGTAGFSIFTDERERALMDLPTRGRPTSMYGFPHLDQYEGASGQTLKISDYIDEPFLLQKIAVEFEGEVEEAGPASIATTIRTPRRWRAARQWYRYNTYQPATPGSLVFGETLKQSGIPGMSMFYRSMNVSLTRTGSVGGRRRPNMIDITRKGVNLGLSWVGGETLQNGLNPSLSGDNDAGLLGYPQLSQLTSQAHMNPYPTFVGGSTRPAIADFSYAYQELLAYAGGWQNYNWEHVSLAAKTDKKGFPKSEDRLFAVQDTTNAASSFSGVGLSQFRGMTATGYTSAAASDVNPVGNVAVPSKFPDFLTSTTGYYSSNPSVMMYYNIPAGVFLPQIERAPSTDADLGWARGRRDGVEVGGAVKLLFGGISGLVTGSYTPNQLAIHNYFSSGSDPRGDGPRSNRFVDRTDGWRKPFWECRNYVTFVDSFTITSGGVMHSTAGKWRAQSPSALPHMYDSGSGLPSTLPSDVAPDTTGGAPFWRCDTFFLLHQKKGKARFVGGQAEIVSAPAKDSFERLSGRTTSTGVDKRVNAALSIGQWKLYNNGTILPGWQAGTNDKNGPSPGFAVDAGEQSSTLEQAFSDGLGPWIGTQNTASPTGNTMLQITERNRRIDLQETSQEFLGSSRTTHRELITYAQITHFGYAATEAVVPGAIIPPENYYVSSSAAEGNQPTSGREFDGTSGTGKDAAGRLLPVTRSFYSQAIKLGATNSSWVMTGYNKQQLLRWSRLGAGSRSRWNSASRLYAGEANNNPLYTTSSDQYKTNYMATYMPADQRTQRGIVGEHLGADNLIETGSVGNPMFLDPGAGSGNGNFWRFSEYDVFGDATTNSSAEYLTGKPFMRQYRWSQWMENPVYGGSRASHCDTAANPSFVQFGPGDWNTGDAKLIFDDAADSVGEVASYNQIPEFKPGGYPVASGSKITGGKSNFMNIDWRYQCGVHYNSAMDTAPIGLAPGPRYRTNEGADAWLSTDPWTNSMPGLGKWWAVGGRALRGVNNAAGVWPTGSNFIGSMVSSASQPWHGTAITRTGFSIITSPTTPVPSGSHPDLATFGSFHTPGKIWFGGRRYSGVGGYIGAGISTALNAHARDRYFTSSNPIKVPSWLDAGLSRDLDIEVGWKFTHAAKEVGDGVAGFTILTASTVFPPGDLAGRFNGDHKLRATFKERRLLNAGNFRVVADIKSQPAAAVDSAALFCFTAPAERQYLVGTGSVPFGGLYVETAQTTPTTRTFQQLSFGDNARFSNDRIWWRAHAIDGGYIGNTTAKEWTTLLGEDPQLSSPRRYVAAVGGNKPINKVNLSSSVRAMLPTQIPQFAPGPGLFRASFGPNQNFASQWAQPVAKAPPNLALFDGRMIMSGVGATDYTLGLTERPRGMTAAEWSKAYTPIVSASLSTDEPTTSLYLLMPGDEIVLGFQPSLHGSNRGNNTIPANPNVNPYGPWRDGIVDRQGIPTGSAYNPEYDYYQGGGTARPELIDSRGQGGYALRRGPNKIVPDGTAIGRSANNANMETLYEPRSSFTIKKSAGAKLVLYGTLLRNKKHVPPQSNLSSQNTAAIHEAIMGKPITDQYQIATRSELSGSYIARLCTGSILLHQRNAHAMGLPIFGSDGNGADGPFSPYNPSASGSFVPLGGPWWLPINQPGNTNVAQNAGNGERGIYRPNMRFNTRVWKGLGGPNQPGWTKTDQSVPPGVSANQSIYWPIAPNSAAFSMGISGSVQRFVRLSDDSEFYYDSLIPNPTRMFDIDLDMSGSALTNATYDHVKEVPIQTWRSAKWSMFNIGRSAFGSDDGTLEDLPNHTAFNPYWNPSFPFEERYKNVRRLTNMGPSMGTTGSAPIVLIQQRVSGTLYHSPQNEAAKPRARTVATSTARVAMEGGGFATYPAILGRAREYWNTGNNVSTAQNMVRAGFSERGATILSQIALFGFWKTRHGDGPPLPTLGFGAQYGDWGGTGLTNYGIIDHPSGWKYGLMNYKKTASSAVFRSDRYGQLRDMLEQRQYTKFWDAGDETNPSGIQEPSVSCIFVDGDGNPLTEPRLTTCFNVSSEMTSSVPYKEGVTARAFLFSSETVSITPLVQSFAASPFLTGID